MEASITLNFSPYSDSIIDILKAFQKIGWDIYNSKGQVEYLPVGDGGMYNWSCEKLSKDELYDIISGKMSKNEQVGVNLFYNDGYEGVSLLVIDTNQVLLSININRRTLVDKRHTDMIWYLNNIIYKFMDIGIRLLSYTLQEYED